MKRAYPKDNLQEIPLKDSERVKRWPIGFQAEIFKLTSDLLTVGFSVNHAIQFCEGLFKKYQVDISFINEQLRDGVTISSAFEPFVDDQIGMQLKLAEQHGQLSTSLGQISRLLVANNARREKIHRLLQYPLILGVLLGLIIILLNLFVFPQINQLTNETPHHFHWAIFGLFTLLSVGIVFIVRQQLKGLPVLTRIEKLARWPLVGRIIKAYYGYYLLSSLAIMAAGGLGTQGMLKTVVQAKSTTLLHQFGRAVSEQLQSGVTLGTVLKEYAFVPNELQILIETGKPQTEIVQELAALSTLYFQRLTATFENLMTWIQPLAFLLLGCLIIFSYVSLFLPMYSSIGGMG